jgi:hypothetical protein
MNCTTINTFLYKLSNYSIRAIAFEKLIITPFAKEKEL